MWARQFLLFSTTLLFGPPGVSLGLNLGSSHSYRPLLVVAFMCWWPGSSFSSWSFQQAIQCLVCTGRTCTNCFTTIWSMIHHPSLVAGCSHWATESLRMTVISRGSKLSWSFLGFWGFWGHLILVYDGSFQLGIISSFGFTQSFKCGLGLPGEIGR